jgi:hypothetical protein
MTDLHTQKQDYLGYVRTMLDQELLMSAPDHWTDDHLERLEEEQMAEVQTEVDKMSAADIQDVRAMTAHAHRAALALIQEIEYVVHEELPW